METPLTIEQRLIAHPAFRWMPGMTTRDGALFIEYADCDEAWFLDVADDGAIALAIDDQIPNLTNPATIGCLQYLTMRAWRERVCEEARFNLTCYDDDTCMLDVVISGPDSYYDMVWTADGSSIGETWALCFLAAFEHRTENDQD